MPKVIISRSTRVDSTYTSIEDETIYSQDHDAITASTFDNIFRSVLTTATDTLTPSIWVIEIKGLTSTEGFNEAIVLDRMGEIMDELSGANVQFSPAPMIACMFPIENMLKDYSEQPDLKDIKFLGVIRMQWSSGDMRPACSFISSRSKMAGFHILSVPQS